MSKHTKVVAVTVDSHTKNKLENAGKSVAEVVTAIMVGSDDGFGGPGSRKR